MKLTVSGIIEELALTLHAAGLDPGLLQSGHPYRFDDCPRSLCKRARAAIEVVQAASPELTIPDM